MFNIINKETWVRKEHFMHFSKYARNSFNLTKEIDVSWVLEIKKQRGFSFYGIMLYLLTQTVNEIPELRMAFI
ncbi:CatA-like O-acetyltransferase [Brochothrix thermosphacta]|uniref:CatA-like O-acetyltransferase n=1 Tax=Brochothrix thermosphacta TaxID=2756 RepID=UPI00265CD58D|nr:CatA-like O-acetyltransferase [Brochothrix thermosphacta]WKK70017.1 CatA-like O-acetyltransferase [Brochothrix thermosphacta]